MKRSVGFLIACTAALSAATPVFAHTGHSTMGGLMAGVAHPIFGIDHLLAMLAVGIWSALVIGGTNAKRVWLAPLIFMVAMVAGALLSIAGLGLPAVETGIAVSTLVVGLMIATRKKFEAGVGLAIVATFAVLHGHGHGSEAVGAIGSYIAGFTLATGMLHLVGVSVGRAIADVRLAAPAIGSLFAAAGAALTVM